MKNHYLPSCLFASCLTIFGAAQAYGAGYTLSTVVAFSSGSGPATPEASLIADGSGNLYDTTQNGGTYGYGTVFEVAAGTHAVTTLVSFSNSNGAQPRATLVADGSGNLYGTTFYGGASNDGTVFEVAAGSRTLSTLATFSGSNGVNPRGGLIVDGSGNLYGTTAVGGAHSYGTVFEVAGDTHTLTTLVSFSGSNGIQPLAGLLADGSGNLYGTTTDGGASGYGTVFEVAAISHAVSTLASFSHSDGAYPQGGLVADGSGNLYGTTAQGGANNDGTVFEVAFGSHTLSTLATFSGSNGSFPRANLVADDSGNLFGTTNVGGDLTLSGGQGVGTVFEVAAETRVLSTVATFHNSNGANLYAGLLADGNGNFYGTTAGGGAHGAGTVFELSPASVPEPASLSLLALGALTLLTRRRKSA